MVEVPVGYRKIEGSERKVAPGARRVADADPNENFAFTVRLKRRPDAAAAASHQYWMTSPPDRRRFLTREQLIARAGASQADLDKVSAFARSHGFDVTETSTARRTVRLSGTVAQANRAFAIDLGRYESAEESYRGREGPIHLPHEMADLIHGVFGLDNRRMARCHGNSAPVGATPLTHKQVATYYQFPTLTSTIAKGQTVGLIEFGGGFVPSDLSTFCTTAGVPTPSPKLVSIDNASTSTYAGSATNPNQADIEVAVDVQMVAAIAQGANIVMFFAPNTSAGWVDAVTSAIYDNTPTLTSLSISYGEAESFWPTNMMTLLSEAFQDAAMLGMSIFASSGDWGSNCGVPGNDGNAHVQYPASDPWVTGCGGTYIATVSGVQTEGTWNDPSGATGGGVSVPNPANAAFPLQGSGSLTAVEGTGFPVPPWQANLQASVLNGGTASLSGRGVPDVAGNASGFSGYPIVVYGQNSQGTGRAAFGTSTVAPLYASLIAIIAAAAGWPMGFLNPLLYAIAAGPSGATVFTGVNDGSSGGNNELDPSYQLSNGKAVVPCPAYVSTSGWNACTGLGHINGTALLNALVVQEETRPFDRSYPFSFGGGGEWLNYNAPTYEGPNQWSDPSSLSLGSQSVGDFIVAGRVNGWNADAATYLLALSSNNAVLAATNVNLGGGGLGMYGASHGSNWAIGVGGVAPTGCGVYGIAAAPTKGIGVAGRSLGNVATEYLPLEDVVGQPIGVLGHALDGPGVRGHGGVLLKQPQAGVTLPAPKVPPAPGGVFSSGRLSDKTLGRNRTATPELTVSLDAAPQLRLIPSIEDKLPVAAQIGDLFLVIAGKGEEVDAASLYICTARHAGGLPQWQKVQLGPQLAGGTTV